MTSTPAPVGYGVHDRVATISMDQPHNRNALTPGLVEGLQQALSAAEADPDVRAVVLTNTGPAFCSGADLSAGADRQGAGGRRGGAALVDILSALQALPKPVVARIAGHCMGGGVGLAAACDLSVAAESARFGFREVRVGVAPAVVSVVCLPKLRVADAMEMFLTGVEVGASRAAEVGLINRAVPPEELDAEVASLVGKVLAGGPGALSAAKMLVRQVPSLQPDQAFRMTAELSERLFSSAEAREGMAAFRERRRPEWG